MSQPERLNFLDSLFSLQGKVAVIIGGTGVLGSAMALALAKAGADVTVIGRDRDKGFRAVEALAQQGVDVSFTAADVLDENSLTTARDQVWDRHQRLDILVNAAGGNRSGAVTKPEQSWFDMDMKAYEDVLALNLHGTVLPSRIFGAVMGQTQPGTIVNIASVASYLPLTQVAAYSQAKAAIVNFTQWLAVEMARKHGEAMRVNAIAPGFFLAEQNRALLQEADGSLTLRGKQAITKTPMGRFGEPHELGGTLVWLCSDAARFVTGATIPVDGGFTAYAGV